MSALVDEIDPSVWSSDSICIEDVWTGLNVNITQVNFMSDYAKNRILCDYRQSGHFSS